MSEKNKSLFKSLYMQYHPMVLHMCLGFMKGDRDTANDLSQEVFINVWNALDRFKGQSSYKTWIYRIIVNTGLQYIRKDKSRLKEGLENAYLPSHLEEENESEVRHQKLYRAIGKLKEIDRLIIMMILEETDYNEISYVVGINETNLRVKIHRIKKRLKTILENE